MFPVRLRWAKLARFKVKGDLMHSICTVGIFRHGACKEDMVPFLSCICQCVWAICTPYRSFFIISVNGRQLDNRLK